MLSTSRVYQSGVHLQIVCDCPNVDGARESGAGTRRCGAENANFTSPLYLRRFRNTTHTVMSTRDRGGVVADQGLLHVEVIKGPLYAKLCLVPVFSMHLGAFRPSFRRWRLE
jgi:hypothetical protein